MLTLILVLFGIIALLIVVAIAIEYFPGRSRRNRSSGTYWEVPDITDHDGPDFGSDDGGWFDGGDFGSDD